MVPEALVFGFTNVHSVKEQSITAAIFRHCVRLTPKTGCPAMAVDLARQKGADLVMATDRRRQTGYCRQKTSGEFVLLNGNQTEHAHMVHYLRRNKIRA
jgi:hypothetical protein